MALREQWADKLSVENVASLSREDLSAFTNYEVDYAEYVKPGRDVIWWIRDLDDDGYARLLDSINDLCWGSDELPARIDRLVDWARGRKDIVAKMFAQGNVSATLAICHPDEFLPIFFQGPAGREDMLRALGLPEPSGSTLGQQIVDANDRLRDHLERHFENDTLGMAAFCYWLLEQTPADEHAPSAWMIRGGMDGKFEELAIEEGLAGAGWGSQRFPDLRDVGSRDQMAELIREAQPETSDGKVSLWVGQFWRLKTGIRRGDLVVMPLKTTSEIAVGVVSWEYWYRDDLSPDGLPHVVSVNWKRTDVPRSALRDDLLASLGSQLTICAIGAKDAALRLQQVIDTGSDPGRGDQHQDQPENLHQLSETLLVDAEFLEDIVELLQDKGQVILYGPPGTGKTHLARKLAKELAPEESCRVLVQFHPSTSYEDFFEGYRPAGTGDDGGIRYELTPGPLARMAKRASEVEDQHVMIIDEINRGNLPRVLGELLFLLEYRDESVYPLYRPDEPFSLPENLWFIGTMNTADRSIALVDAALRRRFHFVPFFPDSGPMADLLGRWLEREDEPAWIGHLVNAVNNELKEVLEGSHLLLGPSHFMREYGSSLGSQRARLRRIWAYNIEPFIEDQFFGNPEQIDRFRFDAVMRRHGPPALDRRHLAGSDEPTDGDRVPDPNESKDVDSQLWRSRAEVFPPPEFGDISDSYRLQLKSVASRWVDYCTQRNRPPGTADEAFIEDFLDSLGIADSSRRDYRSNLNKWFEHNHDTAAGGGDR